MCFLCVRAPSLGAFMSSIRRRSGVIVSALMDNACLDEVDDTSILKTERHISYSDLHFRLRARSLPQQVIAERFSAMASRVISLPSRNRVALEAKRTSISMHHATGFIAYEP
jgi:hypothetical protein